MSRMLSQFFSEPFNDHAVRHSLAAVLALALSAGPVGVFLMLRRMSLVGDAMSHAILPGVALGFLAAGLNVFAMTLGGLVAGLVIALLAGAVSRATALQEDASLAVFLLVSLAFGVVIVTVNGIDVEQLMEFLFGETAAKMNVDKLMVIAVNATISADCVGADLSAAGAGLRRSGISAFGQPRGRHGASDLSGAAGAQSDQRLSRARHAARHRRSSSFRRRSRGSGRAISRR